MDQSCFLPSIFSITGVRLDPGAVLESIAKPMVLRATQNTPKGDVREKRFEEMAAKMDPHSDQSLSRQIFSLLSQAIEKRILKKGDRLPPERELMKTFGVSRGTLRTALTELIAQNYLSATQGRGNFVQAPPQEKELSILALESFRTDLSSMPPLHYGWIDNAAKAVGARVYYRFTPAIEELVQTLKSPPESYDGILIFRAVPDWSQAMEEMPDVLFTQCPLPILILGRMIAKASVDMVSWNYREAAREATCDLIRAGHSRIGFIGGKRVKGHAFSDFHEGYLRALQEAGLTADPQDAFFREGPLGVEVRESNLALGDFLRGRRFSAALVGLVAQPVEQVCAEVGINVPDDLELRLVGEQLSFDDSDFPWTGYAEPTAELVQRGFEQFAETCRGRQVRGRQELLTPQVYR